VYPGKSGGMVRSIVRYYQAWLHAYGGGEPRNDDEVHAWCYRQLALLWNKPSMIEATLGRFVTASPESKRGLHATMSRSSLLVHVAFLAWPLLGLSLARQKSLSVWWSNWLVALQRPDLFVAVGRGPFTEDDRENTPSCLLHLAAGSFHYTYHRSKSFRMDDKVSFHDMCVAANLPTVPVIAVNAVEMDQDYIAKPRHSTQGRGVFRVKGSEVATRVDPQTHFLQPMIRNCGEITAIVGTTAGLSTLRIATLNPPSSGPVVFGAAARLARAGSVVDNFHAGGVGCPVELETGMLKAGTMDESKRANWKDRWFVRAHPDTHQPFADEFKLPHFSEAKELCLRAHRLLGPDLMLCSWDVALTPAGPVLVEAASCLGGGLEVMHHPDFPLYMNTLRDKICTMQRSR
jgi:hypothetical protein